MNGVPSGAIAARPWIIQMASTEPAAAPATARIRHSMPSSRSSRQRLAPSAMRTLSSRARPSPRTRPRCARFAHPISRTAPTATSSTQSPRRASSGTMNSRSGCSRFVQPLRDSGWSRSSREAIAREQRVPAVEAHAVSQPGDRKEDEVVPAGPHVLRSRAAEAARTGPSPPARWHAGGRTPTISAGRPPIRMVLPTTSDAPPNTRSQSACEMTVTRGALACDRQVPACVRSPASSS